MGEPVRIAVQRLPGARDLPLPEPATAGSAGMDLRAAVDALGEITGAVTTEDILDRIFSEFCIGK